MNSAFEIAFVTRYAFYNFNQIINLDLKIAILLRA